jgi:alpha-glucosidase
MDLTHPGALRDHSRDERGVDLRFERGRMRLSFPFDGAARVRFTPEQEFYRRRSWDVTPAEEDLPPAEFSLRQADDSLTLVSPLLRATVAMSDGRVGFEDEAGRSIAQDVSPVGWRDVERLETDAVIEEVAESLPQGRARVELSATKAIAPDEGYYGFGQRTGLLDRRGRRMTNWTKDPEFGHGPGHDNMYQAHPVFLAVRPGLAWGCFLASTWHSRFDVGRTEWEELGFRTLGGDLDYYIFYGPTPADVVERLTRLTGRPFLPPLWSLGYHQSRWGYVDQDDMREIVREFRERDIPLDALHFDIDYMWGYRDFTWDPERFPDPKGLLSELRAQDVRPVTIVDPGVKYDLYSGYGVAKEGLAEGVFTLNPDGTPYVGYCWPDAALFPDFTRSSTREWWGRQHAGHLDAGVEGIWNDMNEPAIFDRPFSAGFSEQRPMPLDTPHGEGEDRTTHSEAHNLYGLLMTRATHEGLLKLRPERRPWALTRSAYTGVQRYGAAWMGDNNSWWEHLELSLPQLASMGLSGLPHVGVDVGGFFDNASPELYARWVLLGAFYPFMRTHSAVGTNRQEPWSFGPEVEEIARRAIKLRYRLLPYLYTLAHEAHRTGAPLFRPMLYDFPDDIGAHRLHDQVMVGPHLLVAPIYHPGRRHRLVYLPEGVWFDFWTGERHGGPAPVVAHAPLGHIPVYVRGGAALTLGNERRSTAEPLTELTLDVYPAGESEWTLIEDDGETLGYLRGELAETRVSVEERPDGTRVRVEERRGAYQPHPRELALRVHTAAVPASVTLDGEELGDWTWDEARRAIELRWPDDGRAHEVSVHHAEGEPQNGDNSGA